MKKNKNTLGTYLLVAGTTVTIPVVSELSGFSEFCIGRKIDETKKVYEEMFADKRGETLRHRINTYEPFWKYSFDTTLGMLGFAGGVSVVSAKRKLEEVMLNGILG